MTFVSIAYLLLLPTVFVLYYTVAARSLRSQNYLLLAASYFFYGWWDWRFLGLLGGLTLTTWACALPAARRRMWAGVNVAVCIGALVAFKYCGFFVENLRWLLANFGWELDWFTVEVLLPVGLSFYALQAISYSVDVARGTIRAERSLPVLALYLSFFPQLVAGPIERASELLPRFRVARRFDYGEAVDGCRRILWGFFKKIVVADGLARWTDWVFEYADMLEQPLATVQLTVGAVFFALQIYADFSGYSDIAIGSARLLGIRLTDNFLFPFFSRDGRELWTRWHRSLYIWFREYVYIPLGGSRRGSRTLHVMAVFLLSGLWHGAAWTFVVWGALCGLWVSAAARVYPGRPERTLARRSDLPKMVLPFTLFTLLVIIFRSSTVSGAIVYIWRTAPGMAVFALLLAGFLTALSRRPRVVAVVVLCTFVGVLLWRPGIVIPELIYNIPVAAAALMLAIEWRSRGGTYGLARVPRGRVARAALYMFLALLCVTGIGSASSGFIYFQF
ncbi:MAG: MBOAT family protein [Bacteroides sp.]|nr:MBOAT family protein [Bacteroides sp.]MCM1096080.1 MBOAT family protein [Terasakiella sp.]